MTSRPVPPRRWRLIRRHFRNERGSPSPRKESRLEIRDRRHWHTWASTSMITLDVISIIYSPITAGYAGSSKKPFSCTSLWWKLSFQKKHVYSFSKVISNLLGPIKRFDLKMFSGHIAQSRSPRQRLISAWPIPLLIHVIFRQCSNSRGGRILVTKSERTVYVECVRNTGAYKWRAVPFRRENDGGSWRRREAPK